MYKNFATKKLLLCTRKTLNPADFKPPPSSSVLVNNQNTQPLYRLTCSVFLGRGQVSRSVLSVRRWGHASLFLTSFMTPSSLSDEFTSKNSVESCSSESEDGVMKNHFERVTIQVELQVFLTTQTRSSPLTRTRSR